MVIKLYFSSVSSSLELKKHQQKITMVLDGKKIPYEIIDVSSDEGGKAEMKSLAGDNAAPPQIANDDQYCGDFGAFDAAVEDENLDAFLKL